MLVVFRVDASSNIGSGHVVRCLTLAEALRENGASVEFISRPHEGHLCELIEKRGFNVFRLPQPSTVVYSGESKYSSWLGVDWKDDAMQTKSIISSYKKYPDWLIVDHYAIDKNWEKSLRSITKKIFVIDDIADRQHDCDYLLNQNLIEDIHARYTSKVPEHCILLIGPKYALLQSIYKELHERTVLRKGPIGNVIIFFGGFDTHNLTGLVLKAFLSLKRSDIKINIVINRYSPHFDSLQLIASEHVYIKLHSNLPSLAPLLAKADLAIGASGCASWERLCLGLPSLIIATADNQKPIAAKLSDQGLIEYLGNFEQITEEKISIKLKQIFENGISEKWSKKCRDMVDGKGVERVCESMGISFEN